MKQRKLIRRLSLGLSVLMLVFSLPTAASELSDTTMEALTVAPVGEQTITQTDTTTMEEADGIVTKEYHWHAEDPALGSSARSLMDDEGGDGGYTPEYSTYLINSDIVPDGVYSLRNWAFPNSYMDIAQGSADEGALLQQKLYYTGPATDFVRRSLFKITRYPGTDYYVIRLMTDNSLSFKDYGIRDDTDGDVPEYNLKTYEISPWDETVSLSETFSITRSDDCGYVIRPYGSTLAIGSTTVNSPEANSQYLELQYASSNPSSAVKWELEKFDDSFHLGDASLTPSAALTVGSIVYFTFFDAWTTKPRADYILLDIDDGYAPTASGFWDYTRNSLHARMHELGTFRITINFTNINEDPQFSQYTDFYTTI